MNNREDEKPNNIRDIDEVSARTKNDIMKKSDYSCLAEFIDVLNQINEREKLC